MDKMDETEKMDLALNSYFESSLLSCWPDADDSEKKGGKGRATRSQSSASPTPSDQDGVRWTGSTTPEFSRLPSFTMDIEASSDKSTSSSRGDKTEQLATLQEAPTALIPPASRPTSAGRTQLDAAAWHQLFSQTNFTDEPVPQHFSEGTSVPPEVAAAVASSSRNSPNPATVSTASSHENRASALSPSDFSSRGSGNTNRRHASKDPGANKLPQLHPLAIQATANCPPHVAPQSLPQIPNGELQANAIFLNTLAANFANTTGYAPIMSQQCQQLPQQPQQQINAAARGPETTVAANMPASSSMFPTEPASMQNGSQSDSSVAAAVAAAATVATAPAASAAIDTTCNNNTANPRPPEAIATSQSTAPQSQSQRSTKAAVPSNENPPPFYLFDAPVELRTNFIQSLRSYGLPVTQDNNSYHYGITVNGFHPQINAQENKPAPQLVDARHGGARKRSGHVKNEREQKRAQKITELIEQLRVNMEKGGWKVEMRSKFHTLSSCANYVKHLIRANREKEDAVIKVKNDLEVKKKQIEEEKAVQESRSDPESVTSSLTSSTSGSGNSLGGKGAPGSGKKGADLGGKRKAGADVNSDDTQQRKRARQPPNSSASSEDSSGGDASVSPVNNVQCVSMDKTVSSVSDITDSNRGSSSNSGSNSGSEPHRSSRSSDDGDNGDPSSDSISSDAAVVRGHDSRGHHGNHADVVIKGRKTEKRKRATHPKLKKDAQGNYELDYEEVFYKSNVPQLIATPAGRIVTWNEFFLKATGLTKADVSRLTIFSLVQANKLSNLFEIVAAALRTGRPVPIERNDDNEDKLDLKPVQRKWDYAAMTLPCVKFPATMEREADPSMSPNQLYITVTLMPDEDPSKQCFHCVFTDCPGTNGALGSITPELLSLLFKKGRKDEEARKEKASSNARASSKKHKKDIKSVSAHAS